MSTRAASPGFTLIEVVITLAIIGLLATMAIPMAQLAAQRSREQDLRAALRDIRGGIDAYKQAVDEGRIPKTVGSSGYPKTLDLLVDGVTDPQSQTGQKIYFLRRIPRDPFSTDPPSVPAADTWGKRSYESPPDAPEEGDDVFDVYSHATGTGLNGIPYKDW